MTALLVIIIVLVVAQMVRYEWRIYKATKYNDKVSQNICDYNKNIMGVFEDTKGIVTCIYEEIDRVEDKTNMILSKLDSLEAKTPYKKRVRKMKVAGVEVPVEEQETKSANANGADVIIDNAKTNKENTNEND